MKEFRMISSVVEYNNTHEMFERFGLDASGDDRPDVAKDWVALSPKVMFTLTSDELRKLADVIDGKKGI